MTTESRPTTRTRNEKRLLKAHEALTKLVHEYVLANGGKDTWTSERKAMYRFTLPTRVGDLCVSVHDDWLACRFEDVERAVSLFGSSGRCVNPQSGKWNWISLDPRHTAQDLFARWSESVNRLLPIELGSWAIGGVTQVAETQRAR